MPRHARERYIIESEESSDDYYPIEVVSPPPRSRSRNRVAIQLTDDHVSPPRRQRPAGAHHHYSYQRAQAEKFGQKEGDIIIENNLNVPQQRHRSSSTGAVPQPNFLPSYILEPAREPSRERVKHYHHSYDHYSDSESDEGDYRLRRRAHPRGRSDPRNEGEKLSAATAEKLAELKLLKERERREQISPATAAKLAELDALKKRREREDEEAALIAKIDERERRDKEKRRQLMLEYQREEEERERAEQDMIAKVEARRHKKEAELKAEKQRALLEERERLAQDAADAKEERRRILAEERRREEDAAEERKRILKEAEDKARLAKEKADLERRRILLEEEERRKKEKEEAEALRKRILAEEEERIKKEKAKKKAEEEEFQAKVREKFLKAGMSNRYPFSVYSHRIDMRSGYSLDYIDDIMEEKKQLVRSTSRRNKENQLAIDMGRPTYIRVQVRHLLPETLDFYQLPWEYDASDRKYIIIKEYVSHEFQQELFQHTEKIYKRRETRLITNGYTKETVTTLKPDNVFKDKEKDQIYLVRRKSQNAKSPNRRSWMFT